MRFVPNNVAEAEAMITYHRARIVEAEAEIVKHQVSVTEIISYCNERKWEPVNKQEEPKS